MSAFKTSHEQPKQYLCINIAGSIGCPQSLLHRGGLLSGTRVAVSCSRYEFRKYYQSTGKKRAQVLENLKLCSADAPLPPDSLGLNAEPACLSAIIWLQTAI